MKLPALASALALVLVTLGMAGFLTLGQPRAASAAEVLARVEQSAKGGAALDIRSFHGDYTFRSRHDANGAFFESHRETWFVASDKYLSRGTMRDVDGREWSWFGGTDGKLRYNYRSDMGQLQLYDPLPASESGDNRSMMDPLQIHLLEPSDLQTVIEGARQKTPPVDPRSEPRPPYIYDAKLAGSDTILGRPAHVIELTLVPGASLQQPGAQIPERVKLWVDKQIYVVLRTEGWDAQGRVLESSGYTTFEVNKSVDQTVFNFTPPSDAAIVDMRLADAEALGNGWQQASRQAPFALFTVAEPSLTSLGLIPGRPIFYEARGTVSQMFQAEVVIKVPSSTWSVQGGKYTNAGDGSQPASRTETRPRLVMVQGSPSSISTAALSGGKAVQIGNITGHMYKRDGLHVLIFDRDGTRIMLSELVYPGYQGAGSLDEQAVEDLILKAAESLQSVK
ncbi:MAG TPA: sigma-E factor regulatory protein RseB domain-containing protein [Chloroflexia bacterium]|nr:sigma-E factor regulatory protein RseB domain-containing protein [Chloroflexia bacterium]